jgi:hypothetical protein
MLFNATKSVSVTVGPSKSTPAIHGSPEVANRPLFAHTQPD